MICEGKKKKKKKDKKLTKKEKKNLTKGIVKPFGDFNINKTKRPVDTKPGSEERDIQVREIMRNSGAKAIQKELERRRQENGG
jgi:hypothetical protein